MLKTWGQITGHALLRGQPLSYTDALVAATAVTHGLALVTRNTRDVEALPVPMLNPWDGTDAA